ncbi:MAG: hypothetical protein KAI39_10975 [Desulfobulbaceae bacterium]|nr:hypothetical protein [Desulfobulbaceae bacterium]
MKEQQTPCCQICGTDQEVRETAEYMACPACRSLIETISNHPEYIKKLWTELGDEPLLPKSGATLDKEQIELPEVLDGKRYRAIDRDKNKWYLSVSEVNDQPVEVFASTAFDRDNQLQSRISNLTTITRLISLILRHIFLNETITLEKCLKQIKRSSRNKNDLPDMLYGVLNRYSGLKDAEK